MMLSRPLLMYRFGADEQRVRELLSEHDPDRLADQLLQERYGSLTEALMEQVKRRPRR